MFEELTLQILREGAWRDIAIMELLDLANGANGACRFEYDFDYTGSYPDQPKDPARFFNRFAVLCPVEIDVWMFDRWPAFIDDLRPSGAAQRWWTRRLGLEDVPRAEREVTLLRSATATPVGNLRIAQSVPSKNAEPAEFRVSDVVERQYDFLEYAAEMGAAVGGATGAGGEAPKILLRVSDQDKVWIDTWQDQPNQPDEHYLVKFARGERSHRDQVILRSEFVYYKALAELGVDTVDVSRMRLLEGDEPSLWLPRFDVTRENGEEVRHGMESLYALIGAPAASTQSHFTYLKALHEFFSTQLGYDKTALTVEYVKRDLLNILFGNPDNHGRNSAVLRTKEGLRLAPVFDFAPMKMDPEGIIRSTRWSSFEQGATIDWPGVFDALGQYAHIPRLKEDLRSFATRLIELPNLLGDLGLSDETLSFPSIALGRTADKLVAWGLA